MLLDKLAVNSLSFQLLQNLFFRFFLCTCSCRKVSSLFCWFLSCVLFEPLGVFTGMIFLFLQRSIHIWKWLIVYLARTVGNIKFIYILFLGELVWEFKIAMCFKSCQICRIAKPLFWIELLTFTKLNLKTTCKQAV